MSESTPTQATPDRQTLRSPSLHVAWSAAFFSMVTLFLLGSHFPVPLWVACAVAGASYVLGVTVGERRGR